MFGPDVGIVAYAVRRSFTVDGKAVTFEAADSSTWIKQDGQWTCPMHTGSIISDPFGRDKSKE
jgi:hypothetical protein